MEGLYNFYKDHGVPYTSHDFSTVCKEVEVTEVSVGVESTIVKTTSLLDTNVEQWLLTESTSPANVSHSSSQLRLVWVPLIKYTTPWQYQIRKPTFNLILNHFQIEHAIGYGSTAAAGFANFRLGAQTDLTRSYSIFMSDLLIVAWSFNSSTGTTRGVCLADPWIISTTQKLLGYQSALFSHPMALGIIVTSVLGHLVDRDLLRDNRTIAEVENRTCYHGWQRSLVGTVKGDYGTLSARMSGCATSLAGLKRITKVMRETLKSVSAFSEREEGKLWESRKEHSQMTVKSMRECESMLVERLGVQETQAGFLAQRTEIQLTALFNLIAQKDAQLNITLAKDSRTLASASKRDSSSMKTLAAVTVAFLPGTFVASFFAMPLFDWDAQQNAAVVKDRFWIYWVVTAPLTIATLVIWLSWTHRQSLIHRTQDCQDRDQLVDELNERERLDIDRDRLSKSGRAMR